LYPHPERKKQIERTKVIAILFIVSFSRDLKIENKKIPARYYPTGILKREALI
jgi:hypothetical protein